MNGLYLLLLTGLQTLPCQLPLMSRAMHLPHSLPADREEREKLCISSQMYLVLPRECTLFNRMHSFKGRTLQKEIPVSMSARHHVQWWPGRHECTQWKGTWSSHRTAWAHFDKLTSGITNRSLFKTQKSSFVKFSMFTSSLLLGTVFYSLPSFTSPFWPFPVAKCTCILFLYRLL